MELNRTWIASLGRGQWTSARALQAVLALACAVTFVALAASASMLSGLVLGHTGLGRSIHLVASYGALLVLGIHAGTHVRPKSVLANFALALWAAYGVPCFFALGIAGYVTMATPFASFSTSAPLILHLFDHASVFVMAAALGSLLMRAWLGRASRHPDQKGEDHAQRN